MRNAKKRLSLILAAALVFSLLNVSALTAAGRVNVFATPVKYTLSIDGKNVSLSAYNIEDSVYFKLRDVASAFCDTRKHFNVAFDAVENEITVLSGSAYTPAGGELDLSAGAETKTATPTTSKIYLNNHYHELGYTAYSIDDNNYLKLPDLAAALDFYIASVDDNTISIDTSAGYSVTGNKIYYSDDVCLADSPEAGAKSSLKADLDGDGETEAAELVASAYESRQWTLVYKDGKSTASVPVLEGYEYGFGTSIAAGHIVSEDSVDFLIASNLMSMPFGGSYYELYSYQNGVFAKIDISKIMDGTEFDLSVDKSNKTVKLTANGSEKTAGLSDMALSDYKRYGQGFCQAFFTEMKLQSAEGCALPELVTTEAIAAVLPNALTYLHTTYQLSNGSFQAQSTEFYNINEGLSGIKGGTETIAPVLIYSLPDSAFGLPLSQIPYYQRGRIQYMPEYVFEQFKKGHQPWLAGAVDVVSVMCSNLTGLDSIVMPDENIEIHTAKELKTKNGVDIKVVVETGKNIEVEMTVPGLGTYEITLEPPEGTAILFVRKIVFYPALQKTGTADSTSILLYTIRDQFDLSPAPAELPDYEAGNLSSGRLISYEDWYYHGGHQPWRQEPFELLQVVTSNLVPENISPHEYYFHAGWTKSGNTAATEDGIVIKLLSPDDPSLDNPSDATELTYQLLVPGLGSYNITVSKPYGSVSFIVTKILFHPGAFDLSDGLDLTAWLTINTDIPVYLPAAWQPVIQGLAQVGTDAKYPYFYFELSGDADSYGINVYRSENAVKLNDQNDYIKQNGRPVSEADFIGSIGAEAITDTNDNGLSCVIPADAKSFELIPGLTAYEKGGGTSVCWKEKDWYFDFNGSSAGIDTLRELAKAWKNADVQVALTGKVKVVEGNWFTFYYDWDKGGYRYEFVTHSTDFNDTIKILISFIDVNYNTQPWLDVPQKTSWPTRDMTFDRISFGADRDWIVYRMGRGPDSEDVLSDGSSVLTYHQPPVKYVPSAGGNTVELPGTAVNVTFYLDGSQCVDKKGLRGVYRIDVYGDCEMTGREISDGTLTGVLSQYGGPNAVERDGNSYILWYYRPDDSDKRMWFEVKYGELTKRMGIVCLCESDDIEPNAAVARLINASTAG